MTLTISSGIPPRPPHDQDGPNESALLVWKVRCIDGRSRQFFDRKLALTNSMVSQAEWRAILPLVATTLADPRLVAHRPKFKEVTDAELAELGANVTTFQAVSLDDYFEDENGKALNMIGVAQILSDQDSPIVAGNVESVLRLGPAGIRQKEKWTVAKANDIAHFLRIIERIVESGWWQSMLFIKYAVEQNAAGGTDRKQVIDWTQPDSRATRQALLPLRQLYSSDDAFNFACHAYLQHVDHDGKRQWVKDIKAAFNKTRSGPTHLFHIDNYTTLEVLDLFTYGSGEVHRKSDDNAEERFSEAVRKYGVPHVCMAFGFPMRQLVGFACQAYHVIKPDFDHWITNEGATAPDRLGLDDLHK